jgi:hypothetical protein
MRYPSTLSRNAVLGGAITTLIMAAMGLAGAAMLGKMLVWTKGTISQVATAAAFAGCVLGGFRAGLLQVDAPLSNGAAAAAVGGVIAAAGQRLVYGKPINLFGLVVVAIFAACCGVFGAVVSNTAARTRGLK